MSIKDLKKGTTIVVKVNGHPEKVDLISIEFDPMYDGGVIYKMEDKDGNPIHYNGKVMARYYVRG